MEEIIVKMATPAEAVEIVTLLFRNGFKATEANIKYNIHQAPSVKLSKVKDFPLILTGTYNGHKVRVAVFQVEIGRHCEGAYALRKILKAGQFYFEEKDLFTIRRFNQAGFLTLTLSRG